MREGVVVKLSETSGVLDKLGAGKSTETKLWRVESLLEAGKTKKATALLRKIYPVTLQHKQHAKWLRDEIRRRKS